MSKDQNQDLLTFLKPFPDSTQEIALWLRDFVWDLFPEANELIYDNYNAVAFGWSPTDKVGHLFSTIAVGRSTYQVHFGFYWGSALTDPEKMLQGKGTQYRYIVVKDIDSFPKDYMVTLLMEAQVHALAKVKDPKQIIHGQTIVKSISEKKRLPGKNNKKGSR